MRWLSRGKFVTWLRANPLASKNAMRKAGFRWETLEAMLSSLLRDGLVEPSTTMSSPATCILYTGGPVDYSEQSGVIRDHLSPEF
jgi:hypothetical protein